MRHPTYTALDRFNAVEWLADPQTGELVATAAMVARTTGLCPTQLSMLSKKGVIESRTFAETVFITRNSLLKAYGQRNRRAAK